jgi:DNA-binding winged helix-turn-helix (wHTH) protein/TolB-like protein/tetratricopeptide (TPR) repeat protein
MREENHTVYSFDEFTLDPHRRLLARKGEPVPLTSKGFELLLALIENAGHEISKEELMGRVWADQIVEDANLTVTMAHLRKALGEKASDHRFIVTIPGRGYRFVGAMHSPDALIVEQHARSQITIEHENGSDANRIARSWDSSNTRERDDLPLAAAVPATSVELVDAARAIAPVEWPKAGMRGRRWLMGVAAVVVLGMIALGVYWSRRVTTTATPQIKSIAVLPFKPLLVESRDESLELGMADTLITRLSNIREISVRPISSVRKYGALEQDAIAAGREQRVDGVLDGQIQKTGEKVRVTVRLLRVADGVTIWASQFDEKMTDIFTVQDSISERVTAALAVRLTSEEQRGITKRPTADVEAYQLYLKGRYHLNRLTDDGFFKGRDYFQQAIDKDPNYALAFAGLADSYNMLGSFDALASAEAYPKAREAAEKALRLDEGLAEAHAGLGSVKLFYDWEFPAASREFQRALEIDPSYSDAHKMNGNYLAAMGRFDEALREMKRAQELDPLSLEKIASTGDILYFQRQYDQAIEQYRKALEMDPNSGFVHWALGRPLLAQGKYDEAIVEFQKAIPLSGDSPDEPAELARAYALSGRRDQALKIIEELKRQSKYKYVAPTVMATIYGALGDKTQAFALLNKAFSERDFLLVLLNVEPMFDPLRSDSRFLELSRRVGLTQ